MNELETKAFRLVYNFYAKWRDIIIETQAQWDQFAADVGQLVADLSAVPCPLGQHLFEAVLDSINDMYKNGMKPVAVGYLGRDDM